MASNRFHRPLSSCALVKVHVELIDQLFNSIDPSPFHTRDMDPAADAFIVNSAKALPRHALLALTVLLDRPPADPAKLRQVGPAIQTHFAVQADAARGQLKELLRRRRISLLIGLTFLSLSIGLGEISNHWLFSTSKHGPGAASKRADRWLGGYVAADGDFPLQLVAAGRADPLAQAFGRDAGAHRGIHRLQMALHSNF